MLPPRVRAATHYQLDFVTPGINPRSAISRKQMRHKPNLRIYARGRPHREQRLCCWTACLGVRWDLITNALRANALPPQPRAAQHFVASSGGFLITKRHAHLLEQRVPFFVVARTGHDRNLHAAQLINLIVIDFRKHDLLTQTNVIVAASIECTAA